MTGRKYASGRMGDSRSASAGESGAAAQSPHDHGVEFIPFAVSILRRRIGLPVEARQGQSRQVYTLALFPPFFLLTLFYRTSILFL
jgi:hypothetical protein